MRDNMTPGRRGGGEQAEIGDRKRVGQRHEIEQREDEPPAGAADRREVILRAGRAAAPGNPGACANRTGAETVADLRHGRFVLTPQSLTLGVAGQNASRRAFAPVDRPEYSR